MVYLCTDEDVERAAARLVEAIRAGKVLPIGVRGHVNHTPVFGMRMPAQNHVSTSSTTHMVNPEEGSTLSDKSKKYSDDTVYSGKRTRDYS